MVTAIGAPAEQIALAPPPPAPAHGHAVEEDDNKSSPVIQDKEFKLFGKDGFTFFDFLDIVNPLQHIPVVNTIYRSITGDQIDPGSKIAGGTVFGGPFGAALAGVDVAVEYGTGKDIADHAVAFFSGNVGTPDAPQTPPQIETVQSNGLTPLAVNETPLKLDDERAYNAFNSQVRIKEPYAAGMTHIPVAKNSAVYQQQQAAAAYKAMAAPDMGMLSEINKTTVTLEETAAKNNVPAASEIQKQKTENLVEKGSMKLQPKDFQNPEAAAAFLKKPDASIRAEEKLTQMQTTMENTKKNWVMDSMLNALDKYQASAKLGLSPAQPALSVVR